MKNLANFFFEVGMLKRTPRTGFQFLGSGTESVAEHIFRTAIIGYTLARLGAYVFEAENPPAARDAVLSRVRIRRVESYERALSDAQIEARSESMRRTYIH